MSKTCEAAAMDGAAMLGTELESVFICTEPATRIFVSLKGIEWTLCDACAVALTTFLSITDRVLDANRPDEDDDEY